MLVLCMRQYLAVTPEDVVAFLRVLLFTTEVLLGQVPASSLALEAGTATAANG